MSKIAIVLATVAAAAVAANAASAQTRWPAGDEIGMANTLGPATWQRCATISPIRRRILRAVVRLARTPCRNPRSHAAARERHSRPSASRAPARFQHRRGRERRSQ